MFERSTLLRVRLRVKPRDFKILEIRCRDTVSFKRALTAYALTLAIMTLTCAADDTDDTDAAAGAASTSGGVVAAAGARASTSGGVVAALKRTFLVLSSIANVK